MSKKGNHYSYYRFAFYNRCEFFYNCFYKQKAPAEEGADMMDGRVQHDILRAYALACFKAKKPNLYSRWEKIAEPILRKHHLGPAQEDRILQAFQDYAQGHEVELKDLAGVEEEVALDQNLKPCRWEDGYLRCKIDRLYLRKSACKISDYKCGFAMGADRFQNELYAWMISKVYPGLKNFELEIEYTRFDYKDTWIITDKDLPKIERKVLNQISRIEQDQEFKPRIGSQCAHCRFWHLCPAMKQSPTLAKILPRTAKSASELLQEIWAKQKQLKELKKILDTYVETNGQVIANDVQAFVRATKSTRWDIPALLEWANREGIMVLDALSVDNRKLERILKPGQAPKHLYQIKLETEVAIKKTDRQKDKKHVK